MSNSTELKTVYYTLQVSDTDVRVNPDPFDEQVAVRMYERLVGEELYVPFLAQVFIGLKDDPRLQNLLKLLRDFNAEIDFFDSPVFIQRVIREKKVDGVNESS